MPINLENKLNLDFLAPAAGGRSVRARANEVARNAAEHLRRVAELPAITGELRDLRLELAARREAEPARHLAAEK